MNLAGPPGAPVPELFGIAVAAWLASELLGAQIVARIRQGAIAERVRADRGSRAVIFLGLFVSIATAFVFGALGLATLSSTWAWIGFALVLVGIGIRQWAIAVLGRYFSTLVRVLDGHRVVDRGPYRLVRHPSYTGMILAVAGIGLISGSWESEIVILAVAGLVFGYRIRIEERLLLQRLGEEYAAYRQRTKRLFPFLL
jgi:protein-S-isoprenylcysteine O-methyltransferase Ste14